VKKTEFIESQKNYWEKDHSKRRSPYHPCVKALFEPRANYLENLINNPLNKSIIDLGCGNGYFGVYLEPRFKNLLSVDSSKSMLLLNPCVNKLHAEVQDLPIEDNAFDIATCSHLLHHLDESDQVKAIKEMKRISKKNIVVFEPYRNNPLNFLFGIIVKEERESLKFSKKYITKIFHTAGVENVKVEIEGCVLPNKSPIFWAPLGKFINKTFLRNFGFYMKVTAML
jgi:SAM-dependent methyltransferase